MYLSIGASSRWGLLNRQLEDVQQSREAPTFLFSGAYVAARRCHPHMMLIRRKPKDISCGSAPDERSGRVSDIDRSRGSVRYRLEFTPVRLGKNDEDATADEDGERKLRCIDRRCDLRSTPPQRPQNRSQTRLSTKGPEEAMLTTVQRRSAPFTMERTDRSRSAKCALCR